MASLLERLVSPLARAEAVRTWPPKTVQEHWEAVQDYRRRYRNNREERLMWTPRFNATDYDKLIYTPVALAREVCNFSAEMLFSDPPQILFETNEQLLTDILEANGLDARLVSMAAMVATEGRGGLRVIFDSNVADVPLITHCHEDEVVWDERHGAFVVGGAVIIERESARSTFGGKAEIYRLVEEHTRGAVDRTLYRGSSIQLGNEVPLETLDEFAGLAPHEDTGLDVPTLIRWDNVSGGYSDLEGAGAILDRVDAEVSYGSEKSEKSRPISWAESTLFDAEGNVDLSGVLAIRRNTAEMGESPAPAGTVQPAFQSAETIAWIDFLVDSTLMFMGYSKASYGRDEGGSADSGKALRMRQARTLLKKAGKDRMAVEAITNALAIAMAWQENANAVADFRPEITLGDGLPRDTLEDAQEAAQWAAAGAISIEEMVRLRHPEWDDDMVEEELARIEEDKPDPPVIVPPGEKPPDEEVKDAQETRQP